MALETPPTLNTEQKRLIEAIHAYWRRHHKFPRTVTLAVSLRKQFDFKTVLSSMPRRLILRDGADTETEILKLTIFALPFCPGEDDIVEAFLELVRSAAKQAIADPQRRPTVTRSDLRGILKDLAPDEFDMASLVIRDGFGWGGSETATGEWSREPSLSVMRFENVGTVDEYLTLDAIRPRVINVLQEPHVTLLRSVYEQWRDQGTWPNSRELVVAYRKTGDGLLLLQEIPNRYRREEQALLKV